MDKKIYIGDSVYAEFDGYHVKLTTENGYPDDPRNTIYLEPAVLKNLIRVWGAWTAISYDQTEKGKP
jgi:hypothetical protein